MTDQTQAADFSDDEKKLIEEMLIGDPEDMTIFGVSRRNYRRHCSDAIYRQGQSFCSTFQ
jgi:hypothetical protein